MYPIQNLKNEYFKFYSEKNFDEFERRFLKTGFGAMLQNPLLNPRGLYKKQVTLNNVDWNRVAALEIKNHCVEPVNIEISCNIIQNSADIHELFKNFCLSTAHTHLSGDFRKNIDFFASRYSSSSFFIFDGAGTCLLLGAMFQSLAKRFFKKNVDLHYSFSNKKEVTHVYGAWNGYFVDPDQKTFVPFNKIEDASLLGFLFQQFGVAGYQIYLGIADEMKERLFTSMSIDYFDFYEGSKSQYMYSREQNTHTLEKYFREAREKNRSPLFVIDNDFPWKKKLLDATEALGVSPPYFLANIDKKHHITVPPNGSFFVGLSANNQPNELTLLSSLFLGRIPGVITFDLETFKDAIEIPELPWMIFFHSRVVSVSINSFEFHPWKTECGRFTALGSGDLMPIFRSMKDKSKCLIKIEGKPTVVSIALPLNALALGMGQLDLKISEHNKCTTVTCLT